MGTRHIGALAIAAAAACTGPVEPELGELSRAVNAQNGISVNGISVNGISVNGISVNGLAGVSLGQGEWSLDDEVQAWVVDDVHRDVLAYLIRCALPADVTLYAELDGTLYSFPGQLGLAPTWLDAPLASIDAQWVSACMLAHVNVNGTHVPISLRGDHPALAVSDAERADYTAEEGAFYGDLFAGARPMAACVGLDGGDDESSPYMPSRVCASDVDGDQTVCGFRATGGCANGWTCSRTPGSSRDGYSGCRAADGTRTDAVVTVYLRHSTL